MKLRNVLCMAAVSAAVALIGVPVNGVPLTVQAEESQLSRLDEILRQIYGCYVNEDYGSMFNQDTLIAALRFEDLIRDSGSDRYVIDLDSSTKAMMYVNPDGGYWYYFGEMTNNLRQGKGTTIILNSAYTEMFTGSYNAEAKLHRKYMGTANSGERSMRQTPISSRAITRYGLTRCL